MADLTAQLQLQYGLSPTSATFSLEVDNRDADQNRPVVVQPHSLVNWLLPEDAIDDPSEFDTHDILLPIYNGYTHVRLYAPLDIPVQLIATEPPLPLEVVAPKGIVTLPIGAGIVGAGNQYFKPKIVNTGFSAGFGGSVVVPTVLWVNEQDEVVKGVGKNTPQVFVPDWEYVGVGETTVMEELQFDFERSKFIKYNYATGVEAMFCSEFLTIDGVPVDPPQYRPDLGGVILASTEVLGAMLIRYNVKYRIYKINYSLPHGRQFPMLQRAWLSGDITRCPMPPVIVVAMSDSHKRIARTQFNKDVVPKGAYLSVWQQGGKDKKANVTLTERSREVERVKVFDPNGTQDPEDPTQYILVDKTISMRMTDVNGQERIFTFKKSTPSP